MSVVQNDSIDNNIHDNSYSTTVSDEQKFVKSQTQKDLTMTSDTVKKPVQVLFTNKAIKKKPLNRIEDINKEVTTDGGTQSPIPNPQSPIPNPLSATD